MTKDDFVSRLNAGKQEIVKIEDLKPNPKNPRVTLTPGMPLYEKLKKSILEFSYIDPIIWNRTTGLIISGHQRLQVIKDIAEEKGETLTELSVIVVEMDEAHQDSFMVAVNKISGLWDQDKLAQLFKDMDDDMRGFSGFDDFEIAGMLDDGMEEDYKTEEILELGEEAESTLKAYNVVISCSTQEEQDWLKSLIKEEGRLKRGYKASEVKEMMGGTDD